MLLHGFNFRRLHNVLTTQASSLGQSQTFLDFVFDSVDDCPIESFEIFEAAISFPLGGNSAA